MLSNAARFPHKGARASLRRMTPTTGDLLPNGHAGTPSNMPLDLRVVTADDPSGENFNFISPLEIMGGPDGGPNYADWSEGVAFQEIIDDVNSLSSSAGSESPTGSDAGENNTTPPTMEDLKSRLDETITKFANTPSMLHHGTLVQLGMDVCKLVRAIRKIPEGDSVDLTAANNKIAAALGKKKIIHGTNSKNEFKMIQKEDGKDFKLFIDWFKGNLFGLPSIEICNDSNAGAMGLFSAIEMKPRFVLPIVYNQTQIDIGYHVSSALNFFWTKNPTQSYSHTLGKLGPLHSHIQSGEKPSDCCKCCVGIERGILGESVSGRNRSSSVWDNKKKTEYLKADGVYIYKEIPSNINDATKQAAVLPALCNRASDSDTQDLMFIADVRGNINLKTVRDIPVGKELFCWYGSEYESEKDFEVDFNVNCKRAIDGLNEAVNNSWRNVSEDRQIFFCQRLLWGLYGAASNMDMVDMDLVNHTIKTFAKHDLSTRIFTEDILRALSSRFHSQYVSQSFVTYMSEYLKNKRLALVDKGEDGSHTIWSGVYCEAYEKDDCLPNWKPRTPQQIAEQVTRPKSLGRRVVHWDTVIMRRDCNSNFEANINVPIENLTDESSSLSNMMEQGYIFGNGLVRDKTFHLASSISRTVPLLGKVAPPKATGYKALIRRYVIDNAYCMEQKKNGRAQIEFDMFNANTKFKHDGTLDERMRHTAGLRQYIDKFEVDVAEALKEIKATAKTTPKAKKATAKAKTNVKKTTAKTKAKKTTAKTKAKVTVKISAVNSSTKKRRTRCNKCAGCKGKKCGECKFCKFPSLKKACVKQQCHNLNFKTTTAKTNVKTNANNRKRKKSRNHPVTPGTSLASAAKRRKVKFPSTPIACGKHALLTAAFGGAASSASSASNFTSSCTSMSSVNNDMEITMVDGFRIVASKNAASAASAAFNDNDVASVLLSLSR